MVVARGLLTPVLSSRSLRVNWNVSGLLLEKIFGPVGIQTVVVPLFALLDRLFDRGLLNCPRKREVWFVSEDEFAGVGGTVRGVVVFRNRPARTQNGDEFWSILKVGGGFFSRLRPDLGIRLHEVLVKDSLLDELLILLEFV